MAFHWPSTDLPVAFHGLPSGTYGAVFHGTRAGETVAVKVLTLSQETAASIQREIALMKLCTHGNIVAYRDAFHRSLHGAPTLWVVMEMALMIASDCF